jgi:hypothetical protein
MKKGLFILMMVIIPYFLFAHELQPKDKYANGKVFLLNKSVSDIYIKVETISRMQKGIQYVDSKGFEYATDPFKANGFWLIYPEDTMVFESRSDIYKALFQPKKASTCFVLRVKKGRLPLYYFLDERLEMDGIDQVLREKPYYLLQFKEEWYPISKEHFTNDFRKVISILKKAGFEKEIKELIAGFIEAKYKFEDTPEVIKLCEKLIFSADVPKTPSEMP